MKKILIPVIGLLVLIILTPFILAKIANSNIDNKIKLLQKQGFQIKEIKKDISYLNSHRVFEVLINQHTKNKTWDFYKKFVNVVNFKVDLSFKNLPITKANMVYVIKYIKIGENNYFQNFKFSLITKDFKNFDFKTDDKNIVSFGKIVNKKFTHLSLNTPKFDYQNFKLEDSHSDILVKDLNLHLFNANWKAKKWEFNYKTLTMKGENTEENITTHLNGENVYSLNDKFKSEKLGIKIKNNFIGFGNFDWNLVYTKNKVQNISLNFNWQQTEYQNSVVDGGEMKFEIIVLNSNFNQLKDIDLVGDIKLSSSLFHRITKDFDPMIVNRYFKNNKTHIEIKNGEIFINGNRI